MDLPLEINKNAEGADASCTQEGHVDAQAITEEADGCCMRRLVKRREARQSSARKEPMPRVRKGATSTRRG